MKSKYFLIILCIIFTPLANADQFIPEFDKMQILKCEIDETIYNNENEIITKTNYHRLFRLDDPFKKIYIQKEPISDLKYYESDKIIFKTQSMTDDYIVNTEVTIDRNTNEYKSTSTITYDNPLFGSRKAIAEGNCKIVE